MMGKVYWNRLDLSVGVLYGDGAGSAKVYLGPKGSERLFEIRNDLYLRTNSAGLDDRVTFTVRPISTIYLAAAMESYKGPSGGGQPTFSYGVGISFDDEDIKLLFALR